MDHLSERERLLLTSIYHELVTGEIGKVIEALQFFQQIYPREGLPHNNLAVAYAMLGRDQEAFQQLVAVHPPAVAHYNLGYLLKRTGKVEEARQSFAQAVRLDPSLAPAKQCLAELGGGPQTALAQAPFLSEAAPPVTATLRMVLGVRRHGGRPGR